MIASHWWFIALDFGSVKKLFHHNFFASALSVTLRRNEQKQNIKRLGKKYYLWSLAPVAPESNTQNEFSQSLGESQSNIKEEAIKTN